jgi:uncharacterized membrane protein
MANTFRAKWHHRFFDPKVRLILSVALGLIVYLFLPLETKLEIRLLLAWDLSVLLLLTLILAMMKKSDAKETLHRARRQEPSNMATLTFTVLTCGASMVAVGFMLNDGANWKTDPANFHLGLCTVAIFTAWLLLHTFFALHYARLYYDELDDGSANSYKKGLEFPGGELVDYWDFMYYSFTIAMCYQTSDVSISNPAMRRLTLVHSIISFIFVALVIGLVVNVVSNLA